MLVADADNRSDNAFETKFFRTLFQQRAPFFGFQINPDNIRAGQITFVDILQSVLANRASLKIQHIRFVVFQNGGFFAAICFLPDG